MRFPKNPFSFLYFILVNVFCLVLNKMNVCVLHVKLHIVDINCCVSPHNPADDVAVSKFETSQMNPWCVMD